MMPAVPQTTSAPCPLPANAAQCPRRNIASRPVPSGRSRCDAGPALCGMRSRSTCAGDAAGKAAPAHAQDRQARERRHDQRGTGDDQRNADRQGRTPSNGTLPLAAAATAITLSRLMTMSATTRSGSHATDAAAAGRARRPRPPAPAASRQCTSSASPPTSFR